MINKDWLEHPETMGAEALEQLPKLMEQHPYCATYHLLYVVALANVHSTRLDTELRKAAVHLPDRMKLFQLVNKGEYEWVSLMQQLEQQRAQKPEMNDFELIDRFLEQMPHQGSSCGYTVDALADLPEASLEEEDLEPQSVPDDDPFSLIDNFLAAEREGTLFVPQAEKKKNEEEDADWVEKIKDRAFLTESLAKVYVKQHKYEQALAIFSQLNLKYSKKNCYFADQIRYLEKVIAYSKEQEN